jgi:hypothetical protein
MRLSQGWFMKDLWELYLQDRYGSGAGFTLEFAGEFLFLLFTQRLPRPFTAPASIGHAGFMQRLAEFPDFFVQGFHLRERGLRFGTQKTDIRFLPRTLMDAIGPQGPSGEQKQSTEADQRIT